MLKYALLGNPGHNRVYFEESKKLALTELISAMPKMTSKCSGAKIEYIADVFYVTFLSEQPLTASDILMLSRLSFAYAVFEIHSEFLTPVSKQKFEYMDSNVSSILKYTGKTNELFTRMMINVALHYSNFDADSTRISLLDPIAGRGTTLFEGLICGYNVYGIEIGEKIVNETYHYFKKYLETERYKHTSKIEKFSGENKSFKSTKYKFEISKTKTDIPVIFELVAGNSIYANKFFKKNSFHIIAGDLPYGVQHGNVTGEKQSSLTRNPKELLNACLPAWKDVLLTGGTIALAWNKFVLSKDEIAKIFKNMGFAVIDSDFEHRVDRSIKRDIIIAKKE